MLLATLVLSVESPGRTISEPRSERIWLIDGGYHVEIALPRSALPKESFDDLPPSEWIAVGWGEERFFRETATISDFDFWLGIRAALGLGESVVHLTALPVAPDVMFAPEALIPFDLDAEGLKILASHVAEAISDPHKIAPGWLPHRSGFYRSGLSYHGLHVCNHWVSNALNAAGLPTSSLFSTLPTGMRLELSWRARAQAAPPPGGAAGL